MSLSRRDAVLTGVLYLLGAISGGVVLWIVLFLLSESLGVLQQQGLGAFLGDSVWSPLEGRFGLLAMALGSAAVTAGALLLAGPLGLLSAIFARYYAPPGLGRAYQRMIALLAGVPSVVYGLWGLTALVPRVAALHAPGPSLLAGVLVLALMILPTVALLAEGALAAVPSSQLQGAAALGLSRGSTLWEVVLPAAQPGLLTALLLATGRALGETMAVLMVCGNVVQVPGSLFDPMRTLTANIALEMGYALGTHRAALFVGGLLLLLCVALLVAAAERVRGGVVHGR